MSLMDMLAMQPSASDKVMGLMGLVSQVQGGQSPRPPGSGLLGASGSNPSSAPADLATEIARRIERRPGFEVSGLEGFQGTGQISSGHIDNSQHYSGMAGDVSYGGGGRFNGEMAALDWLNNWLSKKYGDQLTELIWRAPDHYDHLHYGTRPGG
jgi:hypothetical protein